MPDKERPLAGKVAVVTGASSGIGEATAKTLAQLGASVRLGARRRDRLDAVCRQIGDAARGFSLDVTDDASCRDFVGKVLADGGVDILINNAGLARGFVPVVDDDKQDWREMFEANVLGLMRMTQLFLPALIEREVADIVHVGSVAGIQPYAKGAAYCASKSAVEAFAQALRLELLGTSVRQLVVEPGMVETEFSVVRFHGDADRARAVYDGVVPLSAQDVADCIAFAVTRPPHMSVHTMLIMASAQASATAVARKKHSG